MCGRQVHRPPQHRQGTSGFRPAAPYRGPRQVPAEGPLLRSPSRGARHLAGGRASGGRLYRRPKQRPGLDLAYDRPEGPAEEAGMRLWGGRFEEENDPRVADFTRSIEIDRELADDDLLGSIAHVRGL